MQLVDRMSHVVPFTQRIRREPGPAGIAYVLLALVDLVKIGRPMVPMRRKQVDLKDHPTAAWIIIHHVLQRGVGEESSVPILLAVDLDGWKTWRQRTAGHYVLGANPHLSTVEIGKVAGPNGDRADAQPHLVAGVDAIEIDEPLQRSPQR